MCKACDKKRSDNGKLKERRKLNPAPRLVESAKYRAKKKGLDFNITTEDVSIPEFCPVLGIPLKTSDNGKPQNNSPTIDRIENSKGYVRGNVKIISHRANTLKGNATVEEVEKILKYMKS